MKIILLSVAALVVGACTGVVTQGDGESSGVGEAGGTRSLVHAASGTAGDDQGATSSATTAGADSSSTSGSSGASNGAGKGVAGSGGQANGSAGNDAAGGNIGGAGSNRSGGSSGSAGGGAGGSAGPMGMQSLKGVAFEVNASCADLDRLKVSWYYNWSASTRCNVSAEYVPQVARNWGTNASAPTPAKVAAAGYKVVLGFNEPDMAGQANMSVADVLKAWPAFNQPGLRVGSPATASNGQSFFEQFMAGVQQQGLKVDFIALHWYGWTAGSCTPTANILEDYIKWAEQWKRPLWITEWSCRLQSSDVTRAFYAGAIAMFKRHPLVERYAWFLSRSTGEFSGAALLDANGNATAFGQDYIAAPPYH